MTLIFPTPFLGLQLCHPGPRMHDATPAGVHSGTYPGCQTVIKNVLLLRLYEKAVSPISGPTPADYRSADGQAREIDHDE